VIAPILCHPENVQCRAALGVVAVSYRQPGRAFPGRLDQRPRLGNTPLAAAPVVEPRMDTWSVLTLVLLMSVLAAAGLALMSRLK
jgi:hypothetical protein